VSNIILLRFASLQQQAFNHNKIKITMSTNTKWAIDPSHSEVSFKVKHLMITNVKGVFKEFGGTVETVDSDFSTAKIDFWLNTASVDTSDAQRDGHLKSADFFESEKYGKITFTSTSFKKVDSENYILEGNLTIKDVTKPVKLDVEYAGIMKDPWGNAKAGFVINGKINRKEFGLNWNAALETGGVLVSEEVKINCEVQLLKQVAETVA
jgi:polyisoprenoid-binding protein YceI